MFRIDSWRPWWREMRSTCLSAASCTKTLAVPTPPTNPSPPNPPYVPSLPPTRLFPALFPYRGTRSKSQAHQQTLAAGRCSEAADAAPWPCHSGPANGCWATFGPSSGWPPSSCPRFPSATTPRVWREQGSRVRLTKVPRVKKPDSSTVLFACLGWGEKKKRKNT